MNRIQLNTIGDSPIIIKKGSQVQSQEKTVEITENGTTEVVPDAGYALSKVTVNTNVAGAGEAESTMEYLDISGVSDAMLLVLKQIAQSVKWRSTAESSAGEITIAPYGLFSPPSINGVEQAEFLAAAIDLELLIFHPSGGLNELTPLSTVISLFGVDLATIPRITKEEFYNLGGVNSRLITADGSAFNAADGNFFVKL